MPKNHVRRHHPQRLGVQIGLVSARGLLRRHLRVGQLDAGEDEDGPDQARGNRSQRIEGLRKVQPPLARTGRAQLRDKGVRAGLKKREAAGDDKLRHQKERVEPRLRRRIKHPASAPQQNKPGHDAGLVAERAASVAPPESPA